MASKNPSLSVIIPAYNERQRLGPNLSPVINYFHHNYPHFELIIVDDGSTDGTPQSVRQAIAKNSNIRLISYTPNRGKGFAVRTGVKASKGDRVLFMDADLSTPLTEVPRILKLLESADIVIGSRGRADANITHRPPLFRRLASFIFDQVKFSIVGLRRFHDTQCGFKTFQGPIARRLFGQSQVDRYMFDVEILYMAERLGLNIIEMPVTWADVPGSHVQFLQGLYQMFRDLWRIRRLHSRIIKT